MWINYLTILFQFKYNDNLLMIPPFVYLHSYLHNALSEKLTSNQNTVNK